MKYKDLEQQILNDAEEKDLLDLKNLLMNSNKIRRDVEDLHSAVIAKSKNFKEYITQGNKIAKVDDDIKKFLGKSLFDLIILAETLEVSLEIELEETYKNRKAQ